MFLIEFELVGFSGLSVIDACELFVQRGLLSAGRVTHEQSVLPNSGVCTCKVGENRTVHSGEPPHASRAAGPRLELQVPALGPRLGSLPPGGRWPAWYVQARVRLSATSVRAHLGLALLTFLYRAALVEGWRSIAVCSELRPRGIPSLRVGPHRRHGSRRRFPGAARPQLSASGRRGPLGLPAAGQWRPAVPVRPAACTPVWPEDVLDEARGAWLTASQPSCTPASPAGRRVTGRRRRGPGSRVSCELS